MKKKESIKDILELNIKGKSADRLAIEQRARARSEKANRNQKSVKLKILDQPRFNAVSQGKDDFVSLLKTTLGMGKNGLERQIEVEDLKIFAKYARNLQGKYQGGILPNAVINLATPIDRTRARREIFWSHPVNARFNPLTKTLIISFTTDASRKYNEIRHFVEVEVLNFDQVTNHWLAPDDPKKQAQEDAKALLNSPIKFNCDCGRHTFWYRFIATTGQFAYIGNKPLGREERGFPKIRNPNLNGVACKHVLRTMQTILQEKSYLDFLAKACIKQYKVSDNSKEARIQTTAKDFEKSIKSQMKKNGTLKSEQEKRLGAKLFKRYEEALLNGTFNQRNKDKRTPQQRLKDLAKVHDVNNYLDLINKEQ